MDQSNHCQKIKIQLKFLSKNNFSLEGQSQLG